MVGALFFLASISIAVEPARLPTGGSVPAVVRIAAPRDASVELWASAGTTGPVRAAQDGFRATYTPPKDRAPRVALLLAIVRRGNTEEHAWAAVPLEARQPLSFTTRPSSRVEVRIGDRTFGPVRSDATGVARVPAVVPPGVSAARVTVRDSFGNSTETAFDLSPPPFRRMRLLASASRASWADEDPVGIEVFAVAADGTPLADGALELRTDQGTLTPIRQTAPGVFVASFRAPRRAAGAQATIEARARGEDVVERARLVLRAGPAARIALKATPDQVAPGATSSIRAVVTDEQGNPTGDAVTLAADVGELSGGTWTAPRVFSGPDRARIEARAGALSSRVLVRPAGAPPPVDRVLAASLHAGPASPSRLSAGVLLRGQTNLSRAGGGAAGLELAGSPALPRFTLFGRAASVELLGRAEWMTYVPSTESLDGGGAQRASLYGLSFAAGVRGLLTLQGPWAAHLAVMAGGSRSYGTVRVLGGPLDGYLRGAASWSPLGAVGAGITFHGARGRFLLEAQYASAKGHGALAGNLAGWSLCGGFLFGVH